MNATIAETWDGDRLVRAVTIPLHTVSESNAREHWASKAKRAREQRNVVRMLLWLPLDGARRSMSGKVVKLTRIAPRKLDDDNLRGCLKACRDGVADALAIDDGSDRVLWEYGQRRGKVGEYAVEVTVR